MSTAKIVKTLSDGAYLKLIATLLAIPNAFATALLRQIEG